MDMFIILIVDMVMQMSKLFTFHILNNTKNPLVFLKIEIHDLQKNKIVRQFRNPKFWFGKSNITLGIRICVSEPLLKVERELN